jgi:co-chaperonin GroES (HSP10)
MVHDVDPIADLLAKAGTLSEIEVPVNSVLVAIYKRPAQTKSGIIMPDQHRDEDKYQGKVGLVLKKGPLAFVDDDRYSFHGFAADRGEWVAYRVSDGFPLGIMGLDGKAVDCRLIKDSDIKLKIDQPDIIY